MVNGKRGPRTADDLLDELEGQPEHIERRRLLMAQREENLHRYAEAAAGLFAELRRAGFAVYSLAELRRREVGGRAAVPSLVEAMRSVSYLPLKLDVIATLGSRWARPVAAHPLVEEFLRIDPDHDVGGRSIRWAIGDALERVADESVLDEVLGIARDRRHGDHRGLVVAALGNMRRVPDQVLPTLLALLEDEDVAGYALMGLGKLKAPEARPAVEAFVGHSERWVRDEARKTLKKLG